MKVIFFVVAAFYSNIIWATQQEIAVSRLSEDAFVLTSVSNGTNIGVLNTIDGVVLIDPMPGEGHLDALHGLIQTLTGAKANFILNTHAHSDHTGGNSYFLARGASLIDDLASVSGLVSKQAKSHSAIDNIFYHKKSNSIWGGDIYDTRWHPTFYAGGISGFSAAIDCILQLGDEQSLIVPGHGKPTSKTELRTFKNNTLDWVARVRALKNAGLTVGEMKRDPQLNQMKDTFNRDNKPDFIPEAALVRFIERTLTMIEQAE